MRTLKSVIASHQRDLRKHRIFSLIEACETPGPLAEMARGLAWWPMVFQDVLRLNVERVKGSEFERFAEYHREEDAGHDRWYLEDLRTFSVMPPGFDELFCDDFKPIRDACYALLAEVHREQSGQERIAFVLALESTGHIFFEQISAAVERICPELPLRYFAHTHLNVEKSHDLFTETTDADLDKIALTDLQRHAAERMVARVYDAFADVFSYLADRMRTSATTDIRELGASGAAISLEAYARSS
jgi:hypothetical protein